MSPIQHVYGEHAPSTESVLDTIHNTVKLRPKTRFGRDDLELVARRYIAWTVDYLTVAFCTALCFFILRLVNNQLSLDDKLTRFCLMEAVSLLYFVLLYNHPKQATYGMRVVRIKIYGEHHAPPTFRQALITYLVFSICQSWMNRIAFVMHIVGTHPDTLVMDNVVIDHMLMWMVVFSKIAVWCCLYLMLFYTGGRQSLANYLGKTYVKAVGSMRAT
jgi:uncharacterized RDD family membrane protein YckC